MCERGWCEPVELCCEWHEYDIPKSEISMTDVVSVPLTSCSPELASDLPGGAHADAGRSEANSGPLSLPDPTNLRGRFVQKKSPLGAIRPRSETWRRSIVVNST